MTSKPIQMIFVRPIVSPPIKLLLDHIFYSHAQDIQFSREKIY